MTLDDFRIATELMFQAFTPFKPSDKLRAFYEFFKQEREEDIRLTARKISFEQDKFPSVQLFGCFLKSLKERREKDNPTAKIDCKWCEAVGVVRAVDDKGLSWAYHCHCVNGAKYKNYPKWFGEKHVDKILVTNVVSKEDACPF